MTEEIKKAIEVLKSGGVIVFPTDTVWGVGAAISSQQGIEKLYQVKGREENKPTAVLVTDVNMANRYGVMDKKAWELASRFWPGGLTLVVKTKGNKVPKSVLGGRETVGLRAPNHPLIQELVKQLGEGLVATSANFAGEATPHDKSQIKSSFLEQIDLILEGEGGRGEASTVVDVSKGQVVVLRQGKIRVNN